MGFWTYVLGATVISAVLNCGIRIALNLLNPPEQPVRSRECGICREELTRNTSEIQCKRKHTFHRECVNVLRNEGQKICIVCGEDFAP